MPGEFIIRIRGPEGASARLRDRPEGYTPALREVGEEGVYGAGVSEEAVHIRPEDQAVGGRDPLPDERLGEISALRLAHVDLVALHLPHRREDGAGAGRPASDLHRRLAVAGKRRHDVEEPKPTVLRGGLRLDPGIDDPAPEHLVAAADPDDRDAPLPGVPEFFPDAMAVQHVEILDGVLRPGKDDAVVAGERRAGRDVIHRRVLFEEFEVGEVRYPGEAEDGDPDRAGGPPLAFIGDRE